MHATSIVVLVAHSIHLAQHPGGIQCISSLLDTFEEYSWQPQGYQRDSNVPNEYERDWLLADYERDYQMHERSRSTARTSTDDEIVFTEELVIQGLRILEGLAVHEDNRRVIRNTEGLLSKITMLPLSSDKLHSDYHYIWSSIVQELWKLKRRLIAAPGDTGTKLQREISGNNCEAITKPLKIILDSCRCSVLEKRQVIEILLLDQSVCISSINRKMATESSSRMVMWIMLLVFLFADDFFDETCDSIHQMNKIGYIRRLAGEKLQAILSSQIEGSATSMLQSESVRAVLRDITKTLVDAENNTSRSVHAAQILKHLVDDYTKGDEYLMELKKAMVDVMPKVLKEMLGHDEPTGLELQIVIEGSGHEDASSSHQQNDEQHEGREVRRALRDLCGAIRDKWIGEDTDFTIRQLNEIAEKFCLEQKKPTKDFKYLVGNA
ncbi:hypothetical protein ACP70R_033514 [Stipagrostis hirtigluma subsp. patula]